MAVRALEIKFTPEQLKALDEIWPADRVVAAPEAYAW